MDGAEMDVVAGEVDALVAAVEAARDIFSTEVSTVVAR